MNPPLRNSLFFLIFLNNLGLKHLLQGSLQHVSSEPEIFFHTFQIQISSGFVSHSNHALFHQKSDAGTITKLVKQKYKTRKMCTSLGRCDCVVFFLLWLQDLFVQGRPVVRWCHARRRGYVCRLHNPPIHLPPHQTTEMEKAASVASAPVLFSPQAVLIFGLCMRKLAISLKLEHPGTVVACSISKSVLIIYWHSLSNQHSLSSQHSFWPIQCTISTAVLVCYL